VGLANSPRNINNSGAACLMGPLKLMMFLHRKAIIVNFHFLWREEDGIDDKGWLLNLT
jgi:hypothetical protein